MSTRVKIAIAGAIVAAIVGIIIYDMRSTAATAAGTSASTEIQQPSEGFGAELDAVVQQAEKALETQVRQEVGAPTPAPAAPLAPPAQVLPPVVPPADETYEVRSGDSLYVIAERKYGDAALWKLIKDANPKIKENALRIGAKLLIPPKPSTETASAPLQPAVENGSKTYVIQPGDSLAKLAVRFYQNALHARKIFEANRDVIEHADNLLVGAKIVLPELSAEPEPPVVLPGEEPVASAGQMTYRVRSGDSLWKISKQFANGRGIQETMERIRDANTDKLSSMGTPLQVGWMIVIPE
ncbi:MAG: LysM peptidoglycan-binding domain-containing protein [Planctomycetes bacterium]|nr:LysM peptidoglycan-binding domain-containing protein [Planctomycetota bacterium]